MSLLSGVDSTEVVSPDGDALHETIVRNLLTSAAERVYVKDRSGRFLAASVAQASALGTTPAEMIGRTDFDYFPQEHARAALDDEQRIMETGRPLVHRLERESVVDGEERWVSTTKLPLLDEGGTVVGTYGISRDVTAQVRSDRENHEQAAALAAMHEELRTTESQLRTVLELSPDGISMYDTALRYRYVNPAAARAIGLEPSEVIGRTDRELGHHVSFLATWESTLREALATGQRAEFDFAIDGGRTGARWFHAWIAPELGPDGTVVGALTSARELTALKEAEQALAHQALHDPVTGLPNRMLLMDRLEHAISRKERQSGVLALLFVDLDGFKSINDAHGHAIGDQVLIEVSRRLSGVSRRVDTVARFGGDEFVLLCDGLADDEDVRAIADRVNRTLREPLGDADRHLQISGSIGIVVSADPAADPAALIRDADVAMYQAKSRGRNRYQFFDPELREKNASRDDLATELRRALERGQLDLHYQPLFSLADQRIVGVEALLRWDHPERGMIPPIEFISIAEDRGLITPIGAWVLDEACRQLAEWNALRPPDRTPLTIAVNISAHQLHEPDLVGTVKSALDRHGVLPDQLCLEITETALIAEGPETLLTLETLSELGIHIALDDFGTGFSSLAHLRNFPVDVLKIDRSFVERLSLHGRDREIVAAVTAMAHVLGMTVVGEGIETENQLGELNELACDDGQGYLLARPLPAADVTELLRGAA